MGSFFNVCVYRIPKGVSLVKPGSHCYQCGRLIHWYDNIPLVSYWALGGRCRFCRTPFSSRYFFIELLTACLFAGVFVRFCNPRDGYSLAVVPALTLVSLLTVATFTDIDHWIIPDRVSLGGAVAGFALALIFAVGRAPHNPLAEPLEFLHVPQMWVPAVNSLLGAALGYSLLAAIGALGTLLLRKEAMGQGDWKLFAMIGAFLGPVQSLIAFVLSTFIGTFMTGVLLVVRKLSRSPAPKAAVADLTPDALRCEAILEAHDFGPTERLVLTKALTSPGAVGPVRHHLPFGPYLALAALIVYLAWEPISTWYLDLILYPEF